MTSKSRVNGKTSRMASAVGEVASGGGGGVLRQCRQAQDQLEDAIISVMRAEQQLRENTREVRVELQCCVSRQQEALRCREVWLLGQMELLETLKSEALQEQLHALHRLKGQFDLIVHQLQNENNNNNKELREQLRGCMDRLSSLSLTPEETPELSFHADTRSLRNAITSFGSIKTQEGVTSPSPAHHRPQVQSCPITAKKQRVEASALSQWLLGTPPTSCSPIGYEGSKNPQDWLMSHKENKVYSPVPVPVPVDFLQAWGQLRDLEAWLPVSRGRSSSCSSSSFSIEKIDESEFTELGVSPEEEEELGDWLITPPAVATETESDAERWRRVLKPFDDDWAPGDWLLSSSRPPADCSSCCQTTSPFEIENLGQLKCLKTPPPSSPASSPPSSPASTNAPAAEPPVPTSLEAWLQQVAPLQQTCRANEVCSTYSACLCEQNCGKEVLSSWLLRQEGRDKNGVQTTPTHKNPPPLLHLREQEQKVQAILKAWLHPSPLSGWTCPEGEEKASREDRSSQFKSSSSPFQNPLDPDLWVAPGQTRGSGDRPRPAQEEQKEQEEDKWLLKKRSQVQERSMCDLFSCMKVGGEKDRWLHKAPEQM